MENHLTASIFGAFASFSAYLGISAGILGLNSPQRTLRKLFSLHPLPLPPAPKAALESLLGNSRIAVRPFI